jgi:ankyrin repeat protein
MRKLLIVAIAVAIVMPQILVGMDPRTGRTGTEIDTGKKEVKNTAMIRGKIQYLQKSIQELMVRQAVAPTAEEKRELDLYIQNLRTELQKLNAPIPTIPLARIQAAQLIVAARAGNLEEVKRLIEEVKIPIDVTDPGSNDTPLMIAISTGNLDIVKYLVDHGANLEAKNYSDNTILGIAVLGKHFDIVEYLVEHKANVNTPQLGRTPLALAAEVGSLEIVRYLIEHGADIEPKRDTPLMTASMAGQFEIVKYLVEEKKALVNPKDTNNNYTPLMLVACGGYSHPEIAKYLVEHGADVNAKDVNGTTVLMLAAGRGYLEIMQYLIDKGAVIDAVDNSGKAAIDLALENGHQRAIDLLHAAQAKCRLATSPDEIAALKQQNAELQQHIKELEKAAKAKQPKSKTKKPPQKKKTTQAPKK